jgi:hypothetical protein
MLFWLSACASAAPSPTPALPAQFWATWGDGKAELASYDLVQPRYGELRSGTMVNIVVTEDFSWSERIKADPGAHPDSDIRKVLKLNSQRTFLTGIYPYTVYTSVFTRIEAGDRMIVGAPLKIAFSAQEWCGVVYDELTVNPKRAELVTHTYFDSDNGPPRTLAIGDDTLYGDGLLLSVRELTGAWIPTEATARPFLPSQMDTRFAHRPLDVGTARIHRGPAGQTVSAPAGTFATHEVVVEVGDQSTRYDIEDAWPHRLVAWTSTTGERGSLRGVERLPYWQLNHPGDEAQRAAIGLSPASGW